MENPYESQPPANNPQTQRSSAAWLAVRITFVSIVVVVGVLALVAPFSRGPAVRETARRIQCKNNLKQIAIALNSYHDKYAAFPPATLIDQFGRPIHSWRTLVLPFLEQEALYRTIDLTKPWDDPANHMARQMNVPTYNCPSVSITQPGNTHYLALVGEHQALHPSRPRKLDEVVDGTTQTLLVIEVPADQAVPWMAPMDIDVNGLLSNLSSLPKNHEEGFQGVFIDSTSQLFSHDLVTPDVLSAFTTIDGDDEPVSESSKPQK
jgi:Tfp pilus assembly protein PilE